MGLVWRRSGRLACALGGAAIAACGAFGADDGDAPPSDGGGDGGPADAALDHPPPPTDAPDDDAGTTPLLRPVCPPARYGAKVQPNALSRRKLYAATSQAYPFTIVTDTANVYWLEQVASGADQAPYDGQGVARLVRIDRTGKTIDVLAKDQRYATALVLDGLYAYWTATETTGETHLRRVARTCAPPCTPEEVAVAPKRITKLVRPAPGLLFGQAEYGDAYYRVDLSAAVVALQPTSTTTSDMPGLTATLDHVFVSSLLVPSITKLDLQGAPAGTIPLPQQNDASPGVWSLGTDCESIWAMRAGPDVLTRIVLADGGVTAVTGATLGAFDIDADERYAYLAMPNAGGLRFYDKQSGALDVLAPGNVWRVTVDDLGVYWGEHAGDGTVWMAVK